MSTRILLADDSVTIQKVVELTFMDQPYEVVAVGDGDDAIQRLRDLEPDLVIADVHMPGASGFEVCRAVKDRDPGVPVLLLVGTFEPFDETDVTACGADRFLKKPFDSQELLRLVEEMARRAAAARSIEPAGDAPGPSEEYAVEVEEAALAMDETFAFDPGPELVVAPPEEAAGEAPDWGEDTGELSVLSQAEPDAVERADGAEPAADDELQEPSPAALPAEAAEAAPSAPALAPLSDTEVDRIARRVVQLLGDHVVREVAWEVVPDLAEVVVKERLRELESQLE